MTGKPYQNEAPPEDPSWVHQDRDEDGRFTVHTDILGHTVEWVDASDLA
jgi:hypothetical protein